MGDTIKFIKRYNVALTEHNLTLPNSCKHYLHFNVKLPYFEKELKNCIANISKDASTQKENSKIT